MPGAINIYMSLNVAGRVSLILWWAFFLFDDLACKTDESRLEESECFTFF